MTADSPFLYDAATDSLYVKVRPGPRLTTGWTTGAASSSTWMLRGAWSAMISSTPPGIPRSSPKR